MTSPAVPTWGTAAGASPRDATAFEMQVHPERDHVRVVPVGGLDVASAVELAAQLRELRDAGFERIVLDLHRVARLEATGIGVILAEDRWARANGRHFSVITASCAVPGAPDMSDLFERLQSVVT